MPWSRSYPHPIPIDQPLEIPNDLPVPSTSRALQSRSRAASLARSAGSRPGSRASSKSGDSRNRGLNEFTPPLTQEASDWYDNSNMQSFFDSSALFAPLPEYDLPQHEEPPMDYQNYHGGFDANPMQWNEFGHDLSAYEGFPINDHPNSAPSRTRKKRKRDDFDDSSHTTERSNQGAMEGPSTLPFQRSIQHEETSASGSSGRGVQRKKYDFKFSSTQADLDRTQESENMLMDPSSASSSQEYPTQDRKGKGKAKARTPDPSSIIEILDSPPTKVKSPTTEKPPNEPLSAYTCPICFSAPTNATLTPCGHICCGACLFAALKSTMQRSAMALHGGVVEARCPVCRAIIPGWDGKGGGVIGLKPRAIFRL